ncbi:MAG: hypothetical protein IT162_15300 [Bryobacterales bacterium]|nr:hypothetical protein [Bryobacterales bacterium]
MSKTLFLLLIPALVFGDVTGTVSGGFTVTDNRAGTGGAATPFIDAVIAITPVNSGGIGSGSSDCCAIVNPTTFAVTDTNGAFTASWRSISTNAFPVTLRIEVLMTHSLAAGGGNTHPKVEFTVVRNVNTSATQTFSRTALNANLALPTLALTPNDETAAYLTAREVWQRNVRFSNVLTSRMPGLVIKTRVPNFNFSFGVAPFQDQVLVADGTPRTAPFIVAHEIGHTITWNALGINSAPINPLTDYGLDFHWERDTRESSKAAFLEGMADFWGIIWLSGSNNNVTLTGGGKTFNFETARVTDATGALTLRCSTASRAWEFPFCHTAGLKDLVDNGGGDGVDLALSTIANVLNAFPTGCIFNGCTAELGFNALNHLDFLRNAPSNIQGSIASVWAGNGLTNE